MLKHGDNRDNSRTMRMVMTRLRGGEGIMSGESGREDLRDGEGRRGLEHTRSTMSTK